MADRESGRKGESPSSTHTEGFVVKRSAIFTCVVFVFGMRVGARPSQAAAFWTEDWEGPGAEVASRWSETSCANPTTWPDNNPLATNSSPARTSSPVYSGLKALQYHFSGLQPLHGGCYSSRHFPASDEIWMRWY